MTRTLLNIDAAACSHHDGDTEQACRRTVAALTALPSDYRTGLVRRRALDLFEAIPPSTTTKAPCGNSRTSSRLDAYRWAADLLRQYGATHGPQIAGAANERAVIAGRGRVRLLCLRWRSGTRRQHGTSSGHSAGA
ncbi:hypothetical protein [Streptomyces werraensis]|uniref:hypothetical protein n=1 Tax=Streptomyces werraensis TaxID=68284 RepID=UPI00368AA35B